MLTTPRSSRRPRQPRCRPGLCGSPRWAPGTPPVRSSPQGTSARPRRCPRAGRARPRCSALPTPPRARRGSAGPRHRLSRHPRGPHGTPGAPLGGSPSLPAEAAAERRAAPQPTPEERCRPPPRLPRAPPAAASRAERTKLPPHRGSRPGSAALRARRGALGDRARPRPATPACRGPAPPAAPGIPPPLRPCRHRCSALPAAPSAPDARDAHDDGHPLSPGRTLPVALAALGRPGCRRSRSRGASLLRSARSRTSRQSAPRGSAARAPAELALADWHRRQPMAARAAPRGRDDVTGTDQWEALRAAAPLPGGWSRAGAVLCSPCARGACPRRGSVPAAGVPAVDVFAGAVCSVPLCSVPLCSVSLQSLSPPGRAPAPAEVPAVVTRAAVTTLSIYPGGLANGSGLGAARADGSVCRPLPACTGTRSCTPGRFV